MSETIGFTMLGLAGVGAFALYIRSVYFAGVRRGIKLASLYGAGLLISPVSYEERKRIEHDRAEGGLTQ